MKLISTLLILFAVCIFQAACHNKKEQLKASMHYIPGDDASVYYTGRIDKSVQGQVSFSYPAVEMICAFSGTSIKVVLSQETSTNMSNYMDVWLDGVYKGNVQLILNGEQTLTYTSADLKQQTVHLLKLVKRTEAFVGKIYIHKIGVDAIGDIKAYVPSTLFNIEFIGNSITCGYGNELVIPAPPQGNPNTGFHSKNENAYMSYAGITARTCNARAVYISYSGKGMYQNYDGGINHTMPKLYNRVHPDDIHSVWKMNQIIPDVIVINLGTNDYAMEAQNKTLNEVAFVETYIQFVERLYALYPNVTIICAGGVMMTDEWPAGKNCLTRFKTSINKVCNHFHDAGKNTIHPFFFTSQHEPYGEDFHPTIGTHTQMAQELSAFIQSIQIK